MMPLRTDDGSEMSRKKKTRAPRWFKKKDKILGVAEDQKIWRRQFINRT